MFVVVCVKDWIVMFYSFQTLQRRQFEITPKIFDWTPFIWESFGLQLMTFWKWRWNEVHSVVSPRIRLSFTLFNFILIDLSNFKIISKEFLLHFFWFNFKNHQHIRFIFNEVESSFSISLLLERCFLYKMRQSRLEYSIEINHTYFDSWNYLNNG